MLVAIILRVQACQYCFWANKEIFMKDKEGGIYYYPFPDNKMVRMYVKESQGSIFFRMWRKDDETLWNEHGWVSYEDMLQASDMYTGKAFDPKKVYDIHIARVLIRDEQEG